MMNDEKTVRLTSFEMLQLIYLLSKQGSNLNNELIFKLNLAIKTSASIIDKNEFDRLTRG